MAIVDNNGLWYLVRWEHRKQKKLPIKDASGKTIRVIYDGRGCPTNKIDAEFIVKYGIRTDKKIVSTMLTVDKGWEEAEKFFRSSNKPLKESTVRAYKQCIMATKKYAPEYVGDIQESDIVNLMLQLTSASPATKEKYVKSWASFFNALRRRGFIKANPLADFEYASECIYVEPFQEREILHLLEASKRLELETGEPYHKFLLFALQTGLRLNEYINLRWKYVDWQKQVYRVLIDSSFGPKGNKERSFYIPRLSFEILKQMPKDGNEYIWHKQTGNKWDAHFNRDFVSDIFKASGIHLTEHQDADLHQIRKTFASWRLACGQPIQNLMMDLGHSSIRTLAKYYVGRVSNPTVKMREIFGDYR